MKIVHKYMAISAGVSFIPVPVLDVTALATIHMALIKELSDHYDVEFSQHTARNIVIAIGASLVPGSVFSIVTSKAMKFVAFATKVISAFGLSALSVAVTYAIGRMFVRHFEQGGTLLDFDLEKLHKFASELLPH